MLLLKDYSQGWILTFLSSLLSVLGCLVIFLDDIYYFLLPSSFTARHGFNLKQNYTFLVASLGFSSGSLLFTSLYRLLPTAGDYLAASQPGSKSGNSDLSRQLTVYLVGSYCAGIAVCLLLNALLHLATSESVVHCDHDGEAHSIESLHTHKPSHRAVPAPVHEIQLPHAHSHSTHQDSHSHEHSHTTHEDIQETTELTPLVLNVPKRKFSLIDLLSAETTDTECKGYSSAEICVNHNLIHNLHYCELPTLVKNDSGEDQDPVALDETLASHIAPSKSNNGTSLHSEAHQPHHHHVSAPLSRLLTIGIQTTMAVTLHKFPEGFITYVTSEADKKLGIAVFLSLLVHNFIEGFAMCLPLYYSFSTGAGRFPKLKAIMISGGLGGISQPLGALIGMLFLKYTPAMQHDSDIKTLNFIFGITIAITSGFLTVVGLTMYGSAVSFNGGGANMVLLWSLLGMSVIGGSLVLTREA